MSQSASASAKTHLVVYSEATHYYQEGRILAHGGFVREIDIWARYFSRVTVVALDTDSPPASDAIPYTASSVTFVPIGRRRQVNQPADKLRLLFTLPIWLWCGIRLGAKADVIMGRGPDTLGVLGAVIGWLLGKPRFAKYTDQIQPYADEPTGYKLKKWFYRHIFRAPVLIYGVADPHFPFLVPLNLPVTISKAEWLQAGALIANRALQPPYHIVFAGRLTLFKSVDVLFQAFARLRMMGFPAHLDMIGDGSARADFERMAVDLNIDQHVTFHGWRSREDVFGFYASGFCLVNCSQRQGIDKTILEGMTYALPVVSGDVNLSRMLLQPPEHGLIFDLASSDSLLSALQSLFADPPAAVQMGQRGRESVHEMLIEQLDEKYASFLKQYLGIAETP